MPISNKKSSSSTKAWRIFVTVLGGVAGVDTRTVPDGVEVEIIDFDDLEDPGAGCEAVSSGAFVHEK